MADSKTPVIEIKTIDAVRSVQDLKNNIKKLKQDLDKLEIGSKEYKKTLNDLKVNQNALKNATYATSASLREVTEAAKGSNISFDEHNNLVTSSTVSYNALVAKMAELKAEWRSTTDEMNRNNIGEQINSVNNALKNLDYSTGNFSRNVGNYRGSLEGITVTLAGMKEIGGKANQGFQAMVGTLGMLGIEMDDDNRIMTSWANTLRIINGADGIAKTVKGLKDMIVQKREKAIAERVETQAEAQNTVVTRENTVAKEINDKATKKLTTSTIALKAALLGIAAIIGGVIIANWDKVSEAIEKAILKIGRFFGIVSENQTTLFSASITLSGYTAEMERLDTELDRQVAILRAQGADEATIISTQLSGHTQQLNEANSSLETANGELESMTKKLNTISAIHPLYGSILWLVSGFKSKKEQKTLIKQITEDAKELEKEVSNDEFNLQLEEIRRKAEDDKRAREAALAAAKKRAEDLANTIVKAVEKSKEATTELLEPAEKIKAKYKEQFDLLYSGLTALDQQARTGKNLVQIQENRKKIEEGIVALTQLQTKELQKQKAEEFEKFLASRKEYVNVILKEEYERTDRLNDLLKEVFGYTDAQVAVKQMSIGYITDSMGELMKVLPKMTRELKLNQEIFDELWKGTNNFDGLIKGLTNSIGKLKTSQLSFNEMIEEAFKFSLKNPTEFAKNFEEPLATAIKEGYALLQSDKDIKYEGFKAMNAIMEATVEEYISKGNQLGTAKIMAGKMRENLIEAYKDMFGENPPADFLRALSEGQKKMYSRMFDELLRSGEDASGFFNVGRMLIDEMFPPDNEQLLQNRLEAWAKLINTFAQNYGQSTANLLGNVSAMWDGFLKLRYKKQVESGRLTEEEAKEQAENQFKWVKALQYGAAAINTAAAFTAALADATVPTYVRFINAAAALAAGTAQVLQIRMTEFGAPSVKTDGNSASLKQVDRTPELVYTYGLNTADYAEAAAQNPVRAYVVDRDLSDGLNEYNRRKDNTTF